MEYQHNKKHNLWWKLEYTTRLYWRISELEDDTNCNLWLINAETNSLNQAFELVNQDKQKQL